MLRPLLNQAVLWMLAIVLATGTLVVVLMLQPPTPEDQLMHSPAYLRQVRLIRLAEARRAGILAAEKEKLDDPSTSKDNERAPAAIQALTTSSDTGTVDARIGCGGPHTLNVDKDVQQLRLTGPYCAGKSKVTASDVQNENNGFTATIFPTGDGSFSTDYIKLEQGENRIHIRHALGSGHHDERDIIVIRAAKDQNK